MKPSLFFRLAYAAPLAAMLAASPARAATTFTWTQTAAGTYNWDDVASNWGGGFPNAIDDIVNLDIDLADAQTINLNQVITLGTLNLGDTGSGYFGTTLVGNGGSLILDVASGNATISKASTDNTTADLISANIQLNDNLVVTNAASATTGGLTLSGVISGGSMTLTKDDAGWLTLSGNNSYTGLTTVSAGTLILGSAGNATNTPLGTTGTGTTVSSGGALDLNGFTLGAAETLTLAGTGVSSSGALTNSGGGATYSGVVTLGTGGASIGGAGDITLSAALAANANALTKVGNDTLVLTTNSTRTGAAAVNAGTLRLQSLTALGTNAVALTLAGGNIDLRQVAGTGTTGTFGAYNMTLTASSGVVVSRADNPATAMTATLGTLGMGAQMLGVSPGANLNPGVAYGVTFGTTTLSDNPIFDVANNGAGVGTLTLGALADGGTARTITKQGAGTLTLNAAASSLVTGTVINVNEGILTANVTGCLSQVATTANTTTVNVYPGGELRGNGSVSNVFKSTGTGTPSEAINLAGGTLRLYGVSVVASLYGNLTYSSGSVILDRATSGGAIENYMDTLSIGAATLAPTTVNYTAAPTLRFINGTTLTGAATLDSTKVSFDLGALNMGGNNLSTAGSNSIYAGNVSIPATTTLGGGPTITAGVNSRLSLWTLNDGGVARTITKEGAGMLTLGGAATSLVTGTVFNVNGGVLVATVGSLASIGAGNSTTVNVNSGGELRGTANHAFRQTSGSFNQSINLFSGGTLRFYSSSAVSVGGNLTYAGGSVILDRSTTAGGSQTDSMQSLSIGAVTLQPLAVNFTSNPLLSFGTATLTGDATFDTTYANMQFTGAAGIGGVGWALTKQGPGTLTLSSATASTYTGATTINGGLLLMNGVNTGVSATTVNAGGALGGTGTIPGAVTAAVGTTSAPGGAIRLTNGAVSMLTLGSTLTFNGTVANPNNLYFDLGSGAAGTDKIVMSGGGHAAANPAGSVLVSLNQLAGGVVTPGTYTLIQGGAASAFDGYSLATTCAGGNVYSNLTASGDNLVVTVATASAGPVAAFWSGATSSTWSAANWNTSATSTTPLGSIPGVGTNVTFATTAPVAGYLSNTLAQDFEINSLAFNRSGVSIGGTNMLAIDATAANGNTAGNGITTTNASGTNTITSNVGLGGSQTWTVGTGGTLAVSGAIGDFGGGYALTKAGAGTLTLSGTNSYTGLTTVSAGVLTLSGTTGGGGVTLSGGTLNINNAKALGAGTFTAGNATADLTKFDNSSAAAITLSNPVPIALTGEVTFLGTKALDLGTGPVTLSSSTTFRGNQATPTGGALTIGGDIAGGAYSLTLTKGVRLYLSGTNNFSGGVNFANFGDQVSLLRADDGVGLPATGALTWNNGCGVMETGKDLVRPGGSGAGQMAFLSGRANGEGFSAFGGPVNVCFGTLAAPETFTWGSGNYNVGTLILNYTNANNTMDFRNPVNLNGAARTVMVSATNSAAIATMSGVLSGTGSSGLTKTGVGTLALSNANTYTGLTTVSAGVLNIRSLHR